jgi:N-acetylgalactosamine-6-sulfatase
MRHFRHYPARHRVHGHFAGNAKNAKRGMPNWLPTDVVTLPRLLQQVGYKTAHFGKWHLGGGGLPHGDPTAPIVTEYGYDETRVWNGNGPTWNGKKLWPSVRYMDKDKVWAAATSELSVDATIDFISRHKDGPFFVNLWLKDPHEPLWPTAMQRERYKNKFEDPKQCYYAVLTDADRHIGRLLKKLDELKLADNTLVIFSSDNGPENLNRTTRAGITAGLSGRKRYLHEGGVRVPFIVRWPGKTPAGRINETAVLSTVDLMPTFCALAGAELPYGYQPDGVDMSAALENKAFDRQQPLFWQWRSARATKNKNAPGVWTDGAIRDGNYKLLKNDQAKRYELYNIIEDRAEKNDIARSNPSVAASLKKKWERWQATLPK